MQGSTFGTKRVEALFGFSKCGNKTKNPSIKKGFKGGPTWARTKDPLIMSQML